MTSRPASKCSRWCCAAATRSRPPATCSTPTTRPPAGRPLTDATRPRRAGVDSGLRPPSATRCRRAAPSSTSRRRRSTCRIAGRWSRLTLDLGLRYEQVASEATGGAAEHRRADRSCRASRAAYQLREDGRTVVGASYAHYAGRYTSSIFGRNTPVANSGRVTSVYNGPAGQGYDFAPGLRPARTTRSRRARSRPPTSSSTTICTRR